MVFYHDPFANPSVIFPGRVLKQVNSVGQPQLERICCWFISLCKKRVKIIKNRLRNSKQPAHEIRLSEA